MPLDGMTERQRLLIERAIERACGAVERAQNMAAVRGQGGVVDKLGQGKRHVLDALYEIERAKV